MSAKLEDYWIGLYWIHEVYKNGIYKLRNIEEKRIKNLINGDRLKLYKERRYQPEIQIQNYQKQYMIKMNLYYKLVT